MKFIPIIILSFFLQGCAFLDFFKKREEPTIGTQVVSIDSAAYQLCDLLDENLIIVTFEDGLTAYGNLAKKYGSCAKRQATSVELLKEFSNKGKL